MRRDASILIGAIPAHVVGFIGIERWSAGKTALAFIATWMLVTLATMVASLAFSFPWKKYGITWLRVFRLIVLVQTSFLFGFWCVRAMYLNCFALMCVVSIGFIAWRLIKRPKRTKIDAEMREAVFSLTCR